MSPTLIYVEPQYRFLEMRWKKSRSKTTTIITLENRVCAVSGLRKVYPYYFTFTTFTKGRWVGEKILDVFAREFRAHPVEEYVG